MVTIRKSGERGHAQLGWLESYHTFSFADYYDPKHMRFGTMRVLNEDKIRAGTGFPMHSHQDMEIITYVLSGSLEHKDSMGNSEVIKAGDVQRMSAGTGITHSEYSIEAEHATHLFQIWILPAKKGIAPDYEQKSFSKESKLNRLKLLVSTEGEQESIRINQNLALYASILESGKSLEYKPGHNAHVWIQLASGQIYVNQTKLNTGDAAALTGTGLLTIEASEEAEFLLLDLN